MATIHLSFSQNKNKQIVTLTGELTRLSVTSITKKSIKQLLTPSAVIINLAKLSHIDTAGLAWFFYLLEQAKANNCQLSFVNLPIKLEKLINLSGVNGFLPLEAY